MTDKLDEDVTTYSISSNITLEQKNVYLETQDQVPLIKIKSSFHDSLLSCYIFCLTADGCKHEKGKKIMKMKNISSFSSPVGFELLSLSLILISSGARAVNLLMKLV